MDYEALSQIKPIDLNELVASLTSPNGKDSENAGLKLTKTAAKYGISVRDYLMLAAGSEAHKDGLDGYERTLCELNLPVKDNFKDGIFLQAASETFQTHAGTRALFPEVIDDVLRYAVRQDQFERTEPMVANSRTMAGVELLSTVVDDDSKENDSFSVPEGARIPVRSIRTSEYSVKMYKHGSALRTSYEFSRRASLDLLVPHANRIARELELSKVKAATDVLINGDGVNSAANVVNQSSYNSQTGVTATNGQLSWAHLLYWLVQRAKAGVPVDTVVMNWDGWFQWLMLFSKQQTPSGDTPAESLNKAGQSLSAGMNIFSSLTPVLSSSVPAGRIIGYTKGDTLEELKEAGSDINETERVITNQTITMVKTENTGYRLVYGDTREIFNFNA
jgi:hypothetical protein